MPPAAYSAIVADSLARGTVFDCVVLGQSLQQVERRDPAAAARAYAAEHPEFELHRPAALYNEAFVEEALTYWPDAWLYRLHPPAD